MSTFKLQILSFLTVLLLASITYSQEKPAISFSDLILNAELNPKLAIEAKLLAERLGLPISVYLPQGIFIDALGIEKGKPVYAVVTNIARPSENSSVVFFQEVLDTYNLSESRIHYSKTLVINGKVGFQNFITETLPSKFIMITESTGDRVIALDYQTGSVIDFDFIPPDAVNLSTPIQARLSPRGNVTVSDQLKDVVVEYDTSGAFIKILAPAGGVNNAILDNVRGHVYKSDGKLLVTCADGANQDAIAQFDQSGNYLNNFIAPNATIMADPWDIFFRNSDILISANTTNKVHRYDLNGNYLNDFASVQFPEQIFELSNGNIAVAGFSPPSGLYIYSPTGTQLSFLTA
jgi:hypothetical protein